MVKTEKMTSEQLIAEDDWTVPPPLTPKKKKKNSGKQAEALEDAVILQNPDEGAPAADEIAWVEDTDTMIKAEAAVLGVQKILEKPNLPATLVEKLESMKGVLKEAIASRSIQGIEDATARVLKEIKKSRA